MQAIEPSDHLISDSESSFLCLSCSQVAFSTEGSCHLSGGPVGHSEAEPGKARGTLRDFMTGA